MRVFVTGATGFIGSAIVKEMLANGHEIVGLARSDSGAAALEAAGAAVLRGSVDDLTVLEHGVADADGVIHTAFNHDFSQFKANCEADRIVVTALGRLAGAERPVLVTSGALVPGESDPLPPSDVVPRAATEEAAAVALAGGANVSVIRLPQVHDRRKQGFVTSIIEIARRTGKSAYVGDGSNRWSAVAVSDAARAYRLALERAERGARYHVVAEGGIPLRDIAAAIGKRLSLPVVSIPEVEAEMHYGWIAGFAARDLSASSALTQQLLGWRPTGAGLIADIEALEENG